MAKQNEACQRLYREAKDRTKRTQAKQLAYEEKLLREATTKANTKSQRIVRDRLAKDIEQAVKLQDAHYLTIEQVGSVLALLKVCQYLNCQESSVKKS